MGLKRRSPAMNAGEEKDYKGELTPLVDGDIVVFRSGMAGQYTMREVFSPKDLKEPIVTFRYVKELNEWLKAHKKVREDFVVVDRQVLEPLPQILHTTKLMMQAIEEKFDNKPVVYLTGKGNFREDIAFEQPYKGNRWSYDKRDQARDEGKWLEWLDATKEKCKPPTRPFYEQEIKQYLIKHWGAVVVEGQEADDQLGIDQTDDTTIIVSVDKDLKMIKGWHQDLAGMDIEPEYIDEVTANRNFYKQLLTGDSVDNIKGIHGVGKVKAEKVLKDCNTPDQMLEAVLEEYDNRDLYDPKVITQRGQLLWIRRKPNEMWSMKL